MKIFKSTYAYALLLAAVMITTGCASNGTVTEPSTGSAPDAGSVSDTPDVTETEPEKTQPEPVKELVICKPGEKRCGFVIVYDKKSENPQTAEAEMIAAMIKNRTGSNVRTSDSSQEHKKEIIISSSARAETARMLGELSEGEYAAELIPGENEGEGRLLIAATTYDAAYTCVKYLFDTYYTAEKGLSVPYDLNVKGAGKELYLVESSIKKKLRDPCVLAEDGVYYVYGTGWKCFKNVSGNIEGPWEKVELEVTLAHPETDGGSHWAPEVHKYNGAYYMFTTYFNSATSHRGCIILRSDSPEGPFVEITDGHITQRKWDAIDGTFYVDPDGQPWMVFVHEWTSMKDGIGAFAAAKLSDDLTHFISEPIELFKAKEPGWAASGVTDGCWMYTAEDGGLIMLWSNFDSFGYAVAVARSSNGRLDGEWIHDDDPLYSKMMTNVYDGGHPMVFTDANGQKYISFHSPNSEDGDRKERPVFMAIEEKNGGIVPMFREKTDR